MTAREYTGSGSNVNAGGITQEEIYKFKDRLVQLEFAMPPIGSVMPFSGVSFSNDTNGSPVTLPTISANTIAAVNTYLTSTTNGKWRVCNGDLISDVLSPFNTRRIPNITASRFVMGSTTAGGMGGASSVTLLHTNMPQHSHTLNNHTHNLNNHTHTLNNHTHDMTHRHQITHSHGWTQCVAGAHTHGSVKSHLYGRSGVTNNSIAVGGDDTFYGNSFLDEAGSHFHSLTISDFNGFSFFFQGSTGSSNANTGPSNVNTGPSNANTGTTPAIPAASFSITPTYLTTLYIVRVK